KLEEEEEVFEALFCFCFYGFSVLNREKLHEIRPKGACRFTMDSLRDTENTSSVLNVSSYSLANASDTTGDSRLFDDDDDELVLDRSVLDLLDRPYTQRHGARLCLRKDEQCEGFDNTVGHSWIYPMNYPIRQYQFAISKAALFKNTLVVLPTGLGKTFIAAVVMYNIYRWYPRGKVIFMAPTRPLVSQQIDACYRVMGIPRSDTCELTGKTQRHRRTALWQTKRVFYATPQVVLADLCAPDQTFPTDQVRLVVIDEAHKAKGRYAYTELVRRIAESNSNFRVLALSATPGRTLEDVAEVVKNLLIAHIEVRWEHSIDVQQYTFRRDMRTIVIPLGETIQRIRARLLELIDPYLRRLLNANVLSGCPSALTRGMLIMEQNRYRANALHQRHPDHSAIMADFSVCVSLYHALELLVRYGVHTFLNFFDNCGQEKYYVATDRQIRAFINELREEYRAAREHQLLANDVSEYGHPKYRILERELVDFFRNCPESRVIVFCEFRDSVATINRLLANNQPLIRSKCIVGQGGTTVLRAVPQHEQIATMRAFRTGGYNTLIATCVVEEGIDVGEVDLIVCFDIAKNPSRFVQRIGRTARQRVGRVLMLVTEGEEHATFKKVLATKNRTNQQLARSHHILNVLYRHSPRLVPAAFEPKCVEMFINVPKDEEQAVEREGEEGEGESESATSGRKRRKKKRTVSGSDADDSVQEQPAKRTKCDASGLRDVRELFQRQPGCLPVGASPPLNRSGRFPLQPGRTEAESARERIVQQLVRHREQLHRQKFLHRQQLLVVPTREQLLSRATLKQLLIRSLIGPARKLTEDDPLELPDTGWIEPTPAPMLPLELEASTDNMFETSCTLPFVPDDLIDPVPVQRDIRAVLKDRTPLTAGSKSRLATLKATARKTPADPKNSPLLLAFNRSVCKQKNSNATETPDRRASLHRQMVLEYFLLHRVEDIFADASAERAAPSSQSTAVPAAARKLLFAPPVHGVPRKDKNFDLGSASQVFQNDTDPSDTECAGPVLVPPTQRRWTPAKPNLARLHQQLPARRSPSAVGQCLPERSPYFAASPVRASGAPDNDESMIGVGQVRRAARNRLDSTDSSSTQEDDDFETSRSSRKPPPRPITPPVLPEAKPRKQPPKRRQKPAAMRAFFQSQATVSDDDDDGGVESDEDGSQMDESMRNFMIAESDVEDAVDMHAAYLQSVRSPVARRGGFKIPSLPPRRHQPTTVTYPEADEEDEEDDERDAELDSFIDDDAFTIDTQLTELERAEELLRQRRRKGRAPKPNEPRRRHRRIQVLSSDSE
uniref:Fanconi anemia group M protein n=1 Tax=Anopheles dirus TaxID=7168 RepID=A0A182MZK6_9DIPT